MIDSYEIINNNGEEILYLFINIDNEFANFKENKQRIEEIINKFIEDNKIIFKGTLVSLVVGGVIVSNIIINKPNNEKVLNSFNNPIQITEVLQNNKTEELNKKEEIISDDVEEIEENIEEDNTQINEQISINKENKTDKKIEEKVKEKNEIVKEEPKVTEIEKEQQVHSKINEIVQKEEIDNNVYVTVKRSNGNILKIELEEYVIGVVSAEMPAAFNIEALKAQAVVARTYALKKVKNNGILTDTSSTQNYKDNEQLKIMWGNNYNTYYNKVKSAVESTNGFYLTYNGNYIEAVYHSTSNGQTEDSSNVWENYYPYLVSVSSPYDNSNPSFEMTNSFSYEEISSKLNMEINIDTEFNILSRTNGDRVNIIEINNKQYTGVEFRNKLGLRSADFKIEKLENGVNITTKGYGHGVGMSQYGANGMAKAGYDYINILKHYYTNVTLSHL